MSKAEEKIRRIRLVLEHREPDWAQVDTRAECEWWAVM